jgi:hypothetical protein
MAALTALAWLLIGYEVVRFGSTRQEIRHADHP